MSALGKMLKVIGLRVARDVLVWLAGQIVPRGERVKRAHRRAKDEQRADEKPEQEKS